MFDINQLTIGQAKEIAAMFRNFTAQPTATLEAVVIHQDDFAKDFIGKYVLCRCYSAGVHAGTFVKQEGDKVILANSRRLWSWQAPEGVALSGVSQHGVTSASKLDVVVPQILLTGVIETILCSKKAEDSINGR